MNTPRNFQLPSKIAERMPPERIERLSELLDGENLTPSEQQELNALKHEAEI